MTYPIIKTHYGKTKRYPFKTTGPSLTHQSEAQACDINQILARWQKTGVLEHRNQHEGSYADFTNTPSDYHESMNSVLRADEMFSSLPSSVRRRFHNDPGAFLDFVADPNNAQEMVKMGLAKASKEDILEDPKPTPPKATKEPETPPKTPPKAETKPSA